MSIQIVVDDLVGFKVKGFINDAKGVAKPFDFTLICERLDDDVLKERIDNSGDTKLKDFIAGIARDWSGVVDAEKKPVAFSEEELRNILKLPGLPRLAFHAYLAEVGVKEKN